MIRELMGTDPFASMVSPVSGTFLPDIEIKETKDSYMIAADLPGVREQDLDISVTGNRLTVSGKRDEENVREDDRYFACERSYGSFSRSFVLPEGADVEKVKAELKDGVLNITVPKKAEVKSRRVEIAGQEGGKELQAGQQTQAGQQAQKKAA